MSCKGWQEFSKSQRGPYKPLMEVSYPGELLSIDIIGPLPDSKATKWKYPGVVVDQYSRRYIIRGLHRPTTPKSSVW